MTEALAIRTAPSLGLLSTHEMDQLTAQANIFFTSGLLEKRYKNVNSVIVAAMYGRELGISFQRAVLDIHVVNGRPGMSANLVLSLIRERMPEADIDIIETTPQKCVIKARRDKDKEFQEFSFTLEDAKRAGLIVPNGGWANWPEDMCFARTVTRMGRRLFSDVLGSYSYTPEELDTHTADREAPLDRVLQENTRIPRKVKAEVVADGAAPAPAAAAKPAPGPNKEAINGLDARLETCDTSEAVERAHDEFRIANANDPATLVKGMQLLQARLAFLKLPKAAPAIAKAWPPNDGSDVVEDGQLKLQ